MRALLHLARFLVVFVLILAIDALAGEPRNPATELQTGKHSRLAQEALAKFKEGQGAKMVLRLEEAVSLDPDSPLLHYLFGKALQFSGWEEGLAPEDKVRMFLRAIEEQEDAVRLFPNYREAWTSLAGCFKSLGKYERAAEAMTQLIRLEPSDSWHRKELIGIWLEAGRNDAALQAARDWATAHPNNDEAHASLARRLEQAGRVEEAIAECRRSLELEESDWVALWLGELLARQGRWQEADAAFALADSGFEDTLAWYSRAVMQVRMGNMKEAQRLLTLLKRDEQHNLVKRLQALLKDPKSEAVLGLDAYKAP